MSLQMAQHIVSLKNIMTIVNVYHSSVPNQKSLEKIELLKNYSIGVKAVGDTSVDIYDYSYTPSDVAVIQGWLGPTKTLSPHLALRNTAIQEQIKRNKHVVAVDSNLFLYSNTANPSHYLRYSFNGVFPNTGIYCDNNIDPNRWQKISKNLNLTLKDHRTFGEHILLCLQRNGGWSMGNVDIQDWAVNTINTIRRFTDRPIIVRLHPGDKTSKTIIQPGHPNCRIKFSKAVRLSTNTNLVDDLKNCWAAVNYNSSPAVGAAIEGVPIFVMDPIRSQCAEIADTDLSQIENPQMANRQPWVERLAMFHWNFDELKSGECWSHMKQFISFLPK
jgi:hypothetical protein